jgi:hypothetical protein
MGTLTDDIMLLAGESARRARRHRRARALTVGAAAALLLVLLLPLVARASSPAKSLLAAARERIELNLGGIRAPQGFVHISRPTPPTRTRPTSAGEGGVAAPDAAPLRPARLGRSSSMAAGPPPSAGVTRSAATGPYGPATATATLAAGRGEWPANSSSGRLATRPAGRAGSGSPAAASQGSAPRPVVPVADRYPSARLLQRDAPRIAAAQPPFGLGSQSGAPGSLMPNLEILIAQFESLMRTGPASRAPVWAARAAGSTLELQSVLLRMAPQPPQAASSDTPRPWQRPHAVGPEPTAASPVAAAITLESARLASSSYQTLDIRRDTTRGTPQNAPRSPAAAGSQRLLTAPAAPAGAASSIGVGAAAAAPAEALLAVLLVCMLAALLPARLALDPFPLQSILLTLRLERPG